MRKLVFSVLLIQDYTNPASRASERNTEFGLVNKSLGGSSSATYEWVRYIFLQTSYVLHTVPASRTKMRSESIMVFRRCLRERQQRDVQALFALLTRW